MKILIGCERTGRVRDACIRAGHDAWSCDLEPSESDFGPHIQGDIVQTLETGGWWDLIVLHPECTAMAVCGNRHYAGTMERAHAIRWTLDLWGLAKRRADRVALENPSSVIFPYLRRLGATVQYIQPYQFGHPEQKKTGFALHNLNPLEPTDDVYEHMMTLPKKDRERVFYMSPSGSRGIDRARFYPGFADAIAEQWTR